MSDHHRWRWWKPWPVTAVTEPDLTSNPQPAPDAALLAPEPDGIRLPSDASGASNGVAGI